MPGRRVERLNEQFKRELAEVLRGEARDPRVAAVTITAVRVAPDLTFARVYVAPIPGEEGNAEALAGLNAAAPFLRRELSTRLSVRRIPELRFVIDEALAHGQRIESLLHDVATERHAEPPDDDDHGA